MTDINDTQRMHSMTGTILANDIACAIQLLHPSITGIHHEGDGIWRMVKSRDRSMALSWRGNRLHVWYREAWHPIIVEDLHSMFEGID